MGNSNGKPVVFTDEGKHTKILSWLVITQSAWGAKQPLRRQPTLISDLSLTKTFLLVNLNHFRLLRVVGKGAFGKVRIVERKDTGLTFALKYIRKDEGWIQQKKKRNWKCLGG